MSSLVLCILFSADMLLALLWRWQPRSRRPLSVLFGVLGFALFAAVILGFNTSTLLELFNRDSTLTGRTDVWAYVQTAISDRPLLGFGYSAFWVPGGPIDDYQPAGAGWTPFHAHNGFLELALDVGWLGVSLFAVCAIVGIVRAIILFSKDRHKSGLWPLVMMLCFLLVNLDESSIAKYNNLNWVIFVVAFLYAVSPASTEDSEQLER
jgi:O-antigen ligase